MKIQYSWAATIAAILVMIPAVAFGSASEATSKATLSGDFDGVPGFEIASITGNSVRITSIATGAVRNYTVSSWRSVRQADLDGQPGNELLFTNLVTINGFAQPAQATVLSHRTREVRTFNLGRPNRMQIVDLDDQPGSEVLFTNLLLINGFAQPAQAGILAYRNRELRTYDVGRPNRMQLAELDGLPGSEVLFTNLVLINGFPQPARATVLNPRNREIVSYDAGRPNRMQMVDLDGNAGDEILFTNLTRINGVYQPANASVVTHWRRRVQSYKVGSPRSLQISDFDGVPGNEAAFVGNTSTVVVTPAVEEVQSYSTGPWTSYRVLNADGTIGDELLFRLSNGKSLMIIHRIRAIRVF